MSVEIERKFLVRNNDYREQSFKSFKIAQGYLSSVPERTVRVRMTETKGILTIKGLANSTGVSRYEWEKDISLEDAEKLLSLCEPGIIEKTRYHIEYGQHIFEVDEFKGDNEGLVVAEVELSEEQEVFKYPEWLGEEVTGDLKYYNASLIHYPYKDWK